MVFLTGNIVFTYMALVIYRGHPWKEPVYGNKIFFITIVLNMFLTTLLFFITEHLTWMGLVEIGKKEAGISFAIMMAFAIVAGIYNKIIEALKLHKKYRGNNKVADAHT